MDLGVGADVHHDLTEVTAGNNGSRAAKVRADRETLAILIIGVTANVRDEVVVNVVSNEVLAELVGDIVVVLRVSVIVVVTDDGVKDGEVGSNEGTEVPLVVGNVDLVERHLGVVPGGPGGTVGGGNHTDEVPRLSTASLGLVKVVLDEGVPGIGGDFEGVVKVQGLGETTLLVVVVNNVLEEVDDSGLAIPEVIVIGSGVTGDDVVDGVTASRRPEGVGTISPPKELVLVGGLEGVPVATELPVTLRETVRVAEGTLSHTPAVPLGLIDGGSGKSHRNECGQNKCSDHVLKRKRKEKR